MIIYLLILLRCTYHFYVDPSVEHNAGMLGMNCTANQLREYPVTA